MSKYDWPVKTLNFSMSRRMRSQAFKTIIYYAIEKSLKVQTKVELNYLL